MRQITVHRTAPRRSFMRSPESPLAALLIAIAWAFGAAVARADTGTAVEFYNSGLKH